MSTSRPSARHAPGRAKLANSTEHGTGCELLLVEGDSALDSVCAVRSERTQAVLAFQGKPLNAWTAPAARVDAHLQFSLLAQALGVASPTTPLAATDLDGLRFERIALLFDPDADGIHISALLMLFVQRWWPVLIEQGRLLLLHAPMFEIVTADGEVLHADHPGQRDAWLQRLATTAAPGTPAPRVHLHRGLGNIRPAVLRERSVDPATRISRVVTAAELQAVQAVFAAG